MSDTLLRVEDLKIYYPELPEADLGKGIRQSGRRSYL